MGRVNGCHDRHGYGEDEGVQSAFQRAEDQGHQGELGFIVVRASYGLPQPFGGVIPFVPDFADQSFGAGFRMPVLDGKEVDAALSVRGQHGVEFRVGRQLNRGKIQSVAFPADVRRGAVAQAYGVRRGDEEGAVDAGGGVMLHGTVQGRKLLGFSKEAQSSAVCLRVGGTG